MKVLVVGSGGREHALCWKLSQSPLLTKLWCAPGNPGIESVAECVTIGVTDVAGLVAFAVKHDVDLVIPGPESSLVAGLADELELASIPCCGPTRKAAMLEGSKSFMKKLCEEAGIATAQSRTFHGFDEAVEYVGHQDTKYPLVIKADGLAAGKGVVITQSMFRAMETLSSMMVAQDYGDAGKTVVIEEFLEGEEISFFALCDGSMAIPFGSAKDFKRLKDQDFGPNTGGMGSISPSPLCLDDDLHRFIWVSIILPTLDTMRQRGAPFKGILFAGLILSEITPGIKIPKLLEYNVRFGDPECQSLMMRLESDLLDMLHRAATGSLSGDVKWSDTDATSVVMAAPGYPEAPQDGSLIGIGVLPKDTMVFHSGTAMLHDKLVASGGRVLTVSALSSEDRKSRDVVYDAIRLIDWPEGYYRTDIG